MCQVMICIEAGMVCPICLRYIVVVGPLRFGLALPQYLLLVVSYNSGLEATKVSFTCA